MTKFEWGCVFIFFNVFLIDFDGIRKDKYDELIEISNGPLSSPSLLLFLGKDVQNLQQRYCLTHLESMRISKLRIKEVHNQRFYLFR